MLLQEEVDWLDAYHQRVYDALSPHLSPDEAAWLRQATSPLA
jgi:Xaa-Pro aminopeptidase